MSNIAFLFLPLAFSSLPAVLPFVSPSSQVVALEFQGAKVRGMVAGLFRKQLAGFVGFVSLNFG